MMRPELLTQRCRFRVLDCEIVGNINDARNLARTLAFFNKRSEVTVYVDCDWRGQAHVGWVPIDKLEEGHGIIAVKN